MAKSKKYMVMPAVDAYDALSAVLPMVSSDQTRKHLCCVHVRTKAARKGDGVVELFGTNGHCLAQWKQKLAGAPTMSFSIERRCAKRILHDLKGTLGEHKRAMKQWQWQTRVNPRRAKPKPGEPTISFTDESYIIPFGTMRLDLVSEPFPKVDGILNCKFGGETNGVAVSSVYLTQAVACFQKASHQRKPVSIIQEFEDVSQFPMMRFRTPAVSGHGAHRLAVFVMPVRV